MRLKRKTSPVKNTPQSSTPNITYINKSTKVKADIECKDDLRVAGVIEGKIDCDQKVIVNETGQVNGTITSPSADISGTVTGDIKASQKLTIRPKANIKGDIYAKIITIEEGAQVSGSLNIGKDALNQSNGSSDSGSTAAASSSKSSSDEDSQNGNGNGKDSKSSASKLANAFKSKASQES